MQQADAQLYKLALSAREWATCLPDAQYCAACSPVAAIHSSAAWWAGHSSWHKNHKRTDIGLFDSSIIQMRLAIATNTQASRPVLSTPT